MEKISIVFTGILILFICTMLASAQSLNSTDESIRIKLERGMCFGTCPVYSVILSGNGTVCWEGKQFVESKGNVTASINPTIVTDLFYQLNADGFFALNDSYSGYDITDMPSATLTLENSSLYKQVYHYYGDSTAPERLIQMEDAVDMVANTTRWIGEKSFNGSEDDILL